MASPVQTPAVFRQKGERLDYTPPSVAVIGGDVIVVEGRVMVATEDIAAGALGSLAAEGVFNFPKDASVFAAGDAAYWNPTGTPHVGVASSGCATATPAGGTFIGNVIPAGAQLTGDAGVNVRVAQETKGQTPSAYVAAAGSTNANAAPLGIGTSWVTGADGTVGAILPAVAGAICYVKNDDTANATLKVYPPSGGTINALSANGGINMAAKTAAMFCILADGKTCFTIPLLPS